MKRPTHDRPTGRKDPVNFLMSPSIREESPGRSDEAGAIRGKIKRCRKLEVMMELLQGAVSHGKLEASVFGAAMQTCGNYGWWKGLLQLRRLQEKESIVLFTKELSIALNSLAHSLKVDHRKLVVPERVPIALDMAKTYWREVGPARCARNAHDFNVCLTSALKLATLLNCDAAYEWASKVWRTSPYDPSHVAYSAYINLLEHYRQYVDVDVLLNSQDAVVSHALKDIVLLGSLIDCNARRRDWQRAEDMWATFTSKGIQPNEICHAALAKAYLLSGRPRKVLEVMERVNVSSARFIAEYYAMAKDYAQALLLTCHSSLEPDAIKSMQTYLALAMKHAPKGQNAVTEQLRKMNRVLNKLKSTPREVFLHNVLIDWNARENSVMSEWSNFPAGSNYFENREDTTGNGASYGTGWKKSVSMSAVELKCICVIIAELLSVGKSVTCCNTYGGATRSIEFMWPRRQAVWRVALQLFKALEEAGLMTFEIHRP